MDNHLNLFYSYSQGGSDNVEEERIIEDNITRALIITFKENPYFAKTFLKEVFLDKITIPSKVDNDFFEYDLQNITERSIKKLLQNYTNKYILCISPNKDDKDIKDSINEKNKNPQLISIINWIDELYKLAEEKNIEAIDQIRLFRKYLKNSISNINKITLEDNRSDFQILKKYTRDIFYDKDDNWRFKYCNKKLEEQRESGFDKKMEFDWVSIKSLKYLYDISFGSRPDGWIWSDKGNDKFVVLIENKINGSLYKEQIIRHITRPDGLKSKLSEIQIEIITWEEVVEIVEQYLLKKKKEYSENNSHKQSEKFINHFKEYLILKGIVMDLKFIIEDEFDREKAKNQFKLLLPKLTDKTKGLIPDLGRRGRPLADHIWDYYGTKRRIPRPKSKNSKIYTLVEEITTDPHYSVYLDVNGAGISLTTKIPKLIETMLDSKHLENYLENVLKKECSLSRYSLSLGGYGLFDFKKHAQRGETIDTFALSFNFSKLVDVYKNQMKRRSKWTINKILSNMKLYVEFSKQCELGITIRYPNKGKADNENGEDYKETKENAMLFKDPDKLLEVFKDFITDTKKIFEEISFEKKQMVDKDIEKKRKKYEFVD